MDPQILREKTLENCRALFTQLVPRSFQFQAAYELLAWLQDDGLQPHERVNGIYLLLELGKNAENGFLSTVTELTGISPFPWENLMLEEWLKPSDLGQLSPNEVMQFVGHSPTPASLKKNRALRAVISTSSTSPGPPELSRYEPELLRPLPDFYEVKSAETCWMTPATAPELLWDGENERLQFLSKDTRELFNKAVSASLSPEQSRSLVQELQQIPSFHLNIAMTVEDVIRLIECNSAVAIEVIVLLHNTSKFQSILDRLLYMSVSPQVLEVVNSLFMKMEIPAEAIHIFIENSIKNCQNANTAEAAGKRLVRLLCIFLNSILKHKLAVTRELLQKIADFGAAFPDLKEAVALNNAVKQCGTE